MHVEGLARDDPKGFLIAPHAHDQHQIVHAARGVMRVTTESGAWVVPPGRALWMPRRMVHWIRCATAVSMRTLYISGDAPGFPDACAVWPVSGLLRELILKLVDGAPPHARPAMIELLLHEIAGIDVAPLWLPEPRDARLRRIADALEANPADGRTLAQWSQTVGATPRTLIRLFAKETGMGFREWRRQLRVLHALERLADKEPVTSVALALGYATPSAFIEAFREVLGVTPARYFG